MVGLDVTHQALLVPAIEERLRDAGRIGTFVAELNVFFSRYHRRDLRLGRRADPRRRRRCAGRPAGAPRDAISQCRGRARVGALPRPDRRRPLGADGTPPNAHVGVDLDRRLLRAPRRADRVAGSLVRVAEVVVFVEVPMGSRNKYEVDHELGAVVLDGGSSPRCRTRPTTASSRGRSAATVTRSTRSCSSASRRSPAAASGGASSASSTCGTRRARTRRSSASR